MQKSGLFAGNFFLDSPVESLQKKTQKLFAKAGRIRRISRIIPENQLRGYFLLEGEKATLKVSFTLSPESTSLIQHFEIEEKT